MKTAINYMLTVLLLGYLNCAHSQNQQKQEHHFKLGLDLVSPLGTYMGDYDDSQPLSYISSNLNVIFFGEYRYGYFGLNIPVKLPISHLDLESAPQASASGANRTYDSHFEIGIKPAYYFNLPDEFFQVYLGSGLYIGQNSSFYEIGYYHYALDIWGNYSVFDHAEVYTYRTPRYNYTRGSIFSGVQFQFKNGFGLATDLDIFLGQFTRKWDSYYTNYYSMDGGMYQSYYGGGETHSWLDYGVRFGLYATYQF